MAFPTTGILDNFNRANEGPPPSGSWGVNKVFAASANNLVLVSNAITAGNANFQSSWWSAATFGPDCECYATVATLPAGATDEVLFILARLANPGGTTVNGYGVAATKQAGADLVEIYRVDSAAQTVIATLSQEISAGDALGIACVGSSIQAWYKASGGSWTLLGSATDATYTAAGNTGLELFGTTVRIDDFGGGTVAAVAGGSYTPARIPNALVGPMALRQRFRHAYWPQSPPVIAALSVQAVASDSTFSAPTAGVIETVPATAASATFAAPVAAPTLVASAAAASATFSAPAASLLDTAPATAATATFSAPVSGPAFVVSATAATCTFGAPAPSVQAQPQTVAATATFSAPAPGLLETVVESAATATFGAPVPQIVSGALIVQATSASCTFSAPVTAPAESAQTTAGNATFSAPAAGLVEVAAAAAVTCTFSAPAASLELRPVTAAARAVFSTSTVSSSATAVATAAMVTFSAPAPQVGKTAVKVTISLRTNGTITISARAPGSIAGAVRAQGAAAISLLALD